MTSPLTYTTCQVHHLVVNSQRDRVYVYLHNGAIINGREVWSIDGSVTSPDLFRVVLNHSTFLAVV